MVSSNAFSRILAAEIDGRTQNIRYRQSQFHRLQNTLIQHVDEIQEAIRADSDHTLEEIRAEIALAMADLRAHYESLDLKADLEVEYRIANRKSNPDRKRGAGIVYIVPTSHTMFYSVVVALSAAIGAGNCVIVELPQTTMTVPALLRRLLTDALDADTFVVSDTRPDQAFLKKVVLVAQQDGTTNTSALRCLTSPASARTIAIVDRTANIIHAADALVAARLAFGGRSPYSPDLVLVNEFTIKPFVEAVIRQSSKYLAGENGDARAAASGSRRGGPGSTSSVLDLVQKEKGARVLVSGSNWGIVEVLDRRSTLLQKKVNEKVLFVHPVSSLDDAINVSNNTGAILAASYIFAAPSSAKYLSQFIDAHISWVNHVPTEMLLGPALPSNEPVSLSSTRYPTALFQVLRPQILSETTNTSLINTLLYEGNTQKVREVWNKVISPLPSTNQRPGHRVDFFVQGFHTGGLVVLTSLVTVLGGIGYLTFTCMKR